MSSRRNKRRRSQKEWRDAAPINEEVPPTILRLVRPEEESVFPEPEAIGRDSAVGVDVRQSEGTESESGTTEGGSVLVAAASPEPDDRRIAVIKPVLVEPGIYLVEFDGVSKGPHLAAYRIMFTQTDCLGLLAKIPLGGETAAVAVLLGWKRQFESHGVGHWELCYNDWIRQTPDLMKSGEKFFTKFDDEFGRHGLPQITTTEPCQLLHMGACAEMLYAGQLDKAVGLYNGWARFADYEQIELKSRNPALLYIDGALLQFNGENFKIIKVR